MNVRIIANPGFKPKYMFEDMDERLVKLVRKSLHTNFMHNNFSNDEEEELCELMLNKLHTVIPDDRHILV